MQMARDEWSQAAKLNPTNSTIANNYAYILYKLGENEEALVWYRNALKISPNRLPLQLNLGDVLTDVGNVKEAKAFYERYLELAPLSPTASSIRGWLEEYDQHNGLVKPRQYEETSSRSFLNRVQDFFLDIENQW